MGLADRRTEGALCREYKRSFGSGVRPEYWLHKRERGWGRDSDDWARGRDQAQGWAGGSEVRARSGKCRRGSERAGTGGSGCGSWWHEPVIGCVECAMSEWEKAGMVLSGCFADAGEGHIGAENAFGDARSGKVGL